MKLKKVLASLTAAALAASVIAVTPVTVSADETVVSLENTPEGIESVLAAADLSEVTTAFTRNWQDGNWTQIDSVDEAWMTDSDIYVKMSMTNIGTTGESSDTLETVIGWGWSSYNWATAVKWYNNSEPVTSQFDVSFIPNMQSTSTKAVAYVPISNFARTAWGAIAGNLQAAQWSSVTVTGLEIVEFAPATAPELPANSYDFDTPSGTAAAGSWGQAATTLVGSDKTITPAILAGDFAVTAAYTAAARPNLVLSDGSGDGPLNWIQVRPSQVLNGIAYYVNADIKTAWTAAGGNAAFSDVTALHITTTSADALTVTSAKVYSTASAAPPIAEVKPAITKLVAGDKQVSLNWTSVEGATNYAVYTYVNKAWTLMGTRTATGMYVKGLTNGVSYGFAVKAYVNGSWTGITSSDIKYATPVASIVKPAITKVIVGDSQIGLNWTAVDGATNYAVYTYVNKAWKLMGTRTVNGMYVKGLTNGVSYGFAVKAYVNGSWTDVTSADIKYATPISSTPKPVITKATASDSQVALNWTAVDGATNYAVYAYVNKAWKLMGTRTVNGMYVKGLTNGVSYGFAVKAYVDGAWTPVTSADIKYVTPQA